jgi:hypothetical protein
MSATQSAGTWSTYRIPQPKQIQQATERSISAEIGITPAFMGGDSPGMLNRFGEQFRSSISDISDDEIRELRVFDEFLAKHVQTNMICDVQCMLLWSEWVRSFRQQIKGFPKLVLEKEFRMVIMDKYGVGIAHDDVRGAVYPGIRFLP